MLLGAGTMAFTRQRVHASQTKDRVCGGPGWRCWGHSAGVGLGSGWRRRDGPQDSGGSVFPFCLAGAAFLASAALHGGDGLRARRPLPSLTRVFTTDQIARITFVWIVATAVACLVIPLFGIISNPWINAGLVGAGVWLVWQVRGVLRPPKGTPKYKAAFKHINIYVCWVVALLSVNGIIR